MAGPAFGIVGESFGVELPQTQAPEDSLIEERKAARFTKTAEWKRLKQHFESRIEFYQQYLPSGDPIITKPTAELAAEWKASNVIINELKAVIGAYERAAEVVADADKR